MHVRIFHHLTDIDMPRLASSDVSMLSSVLGLADFFLILGDDALLVPEFEL